MVEQQVVDMIRDQFRLMNEKVDGLHEIVQTHVDKDERYWAKIDQQEGQLMAVKLLLGPGIAAFIGWIYNQFLKH